MPSTPFVSIVVPVLNGEAEVEACVHALRAQAYPRDAYEIIFVDNGSSDGTVRRLEELGVTYHVREKRGRAAALNRGVERSRGSIICTTDVSCVAEPGWVPAVVRCFEDAQVGCVAGEIKQLDPGRNRVTRFQARINYMSPMHARDRRSLPYLPFADGANASFRREVFERIGLFDESFIKSADVEICYRMLILTDYKIVFDESAVVWEPGEPTLKALLKQRFRMGVGEVLVERKYPEMFRREPPSARQRYWQARAALARVGRALKAGAAALARGDGETLYDENVKLLMFLWQTAGRLAAPRVLARHGVEVEPVPADKIRAFVRSWVPGRGLAEPPLCGRAAGAR